MVQLHCLNVTCYKQFYWYMDSLLIVNVTSLWPPSRASITAKQTNARVFLVNCMKFMEMAIMAYMLFSRLSLNGEPTD